MISKEETNSSPSPAINLNELPSKTFKLNDFELKIFQGENSIIYHVREIEDLTATLYKTEMDLEKLYIIIRIVCCLESILI